MNRKSAYRDMEKYRETRNRQKQRYRDQFSENNKNARSAWTEGEIALVLAHAVPDRELSKQIGRSVTAIQIQRARAKRAAIFPENS